MHDLPSKRRKKRQQTQETMRRLNVVGESEAMLSTLRWVLRRQQIE